MLKLPKHQIFFWIQSVNSYYKKWNLKEKLLFAKIVSDKLFKILINFDESKAQDIDDLSGILIKDGATLLTTPITQLCNLPIYSVGIPDACRIAKLKSLFKKGSQELPSNLSSITNVKSAGETSLLFRDDFNRFSKNIR